MKASEFAELVQDDEALQKLVAYPEWKTFEKWVKEEQTAHMKEMEALIVRLVAKDDQVLRNDYMEERIYVQALGRLISLQPEMRKAVSENRKVISELGQKAFDKEGGESPEGSPSGQPDAQQMES